MKNSQVSSGYIIIFYLGDMGQDLEDNTVASPETAEILFWKLTFKDISVIPGWELGIHVTNSAFYWSYFIST